MHTRPTSRTVAAVMLAMLLMALSAIPAAAAKPVKPAPGGSGGTERPLTAEELAIAERKIAESNAYVAAADDSGEGLVTLSCATPTSTTELSTDTSTAGSTDASTDACYVPQSYLPVEARDQILGHYCGPAVGQVIANYSWAMSSGANRYSQSTIAGWMKTDLNGGTNAFDMANGLNTATNWSPRRPSNFAYAVTYLKDTDGDGTVADQLHDYVRTAVSSWKMPLAIPVKPHDPNSKYNLYSWPNPVWSPGHWIAAYGWYSYWTGTTFARTYYTDSSKDEGGGTGKYWNPTLHLGALIMEHTGRFVW